MAPRITGDEFMFAVCSVMNIDPATVMRIIVESSVGEPVYVYVQHVGKDLDKLDLADMLKGALVKNGATAEQKRT